MKKSSIVFLLVWPILCIATPQTSELLIYKGDSIWIDYYPLEQLRETDIALDKKLDKMYPVQSTTCWRGYQGTWKIENDSLYLIRIKKDESDSETSINLKQIFNKSQVISNKVFASWYTENINADYGECLGYEDDGYFTIPIYSGKLFCHIDNGIVSYSRINMKLPSEINEIKKNKILRQDTMVHMVVEEWPVLLVNGSKYQLDSIPKFINENLHYPIEACIQGAVFVRFVVEKDGTISNIKVIRGIDPLIDQEALKVLKLMIKWEPGRSNNRIVRTSITLPFRFVLY